MNNTSSELIADQGEDRQQGISRHGGLLESKGAYEEMTGQHLPSWAIVAWGSAGPALATKLIQSEPESFQLPFGRLIRLLHPARTTSGQNVVCRKTQRKQGQKGCSIHAYGRRSVPFFTHFCSGSYMSFAPFRRLWHRTYHFREHPL